MQKALDLDRGEIAALAALARNRAPGGDCASGHDIRQQLRDEGFTKLAAVLALQSLVARGLVERQRVHDVDGLFYTGYRFTRAGLALIRSPDP
jgi:DNA-binding MarR family transcriptional regulator